MEMALLRVGIDSGCGQMHGPLFLDGSFEYVPIPDSDYKIDSRTYESLTGRHGRSLVEYFPLRRQARMKDMAVHVDPEFTTFTYGDPSKLKSRLQRLGKGDMLVFYCGLEGWGFVRGPALYLMGYFEVQAAGQATDFGPNKLLNLFGENFHVRHPAVYQKERDRLVLVKGSSNSRLLKKAELISVIGTDCAGKPLKVMSPDKQRIFGKFGGKNSLQRSPPRLVDPAYVEQAAEFVRSLE